MKTILLLLLCLAAFEVAAGRPPRLQDPWLTEAEPPSPGVPFGVPPLVGFWIEELEGGNHYTIQEKPQSGPYVDVHEFTAPLDIGNGALGFWFVRDPAAPAKFYRVRNDGFAGFAAARFLEFLDNPFR